MTTNTSETKLSMKLLIDTTARKVLFAEAEKDCVDFLFHILTLPVGTVTRLLKEKEMKCGCLPNLYASVENLNDKYIQSNQCKAILLKSMSSAGNITSVPKGGFVKEAVTYMVMDELIVKPMSTISGITLLNKFNVKDVGMLQEVIVSFGMDEALKLLKASFESKAVLTSVFMSLIKAEK